MATERQFLETVARCVSVMVFYHNAHKGPSTKARMIAEVQLIAGWIEELGLEPSDTERHIFRPLEDELFARYGHEVAPRLHDDFLKAFEGLRTSCRTPEAREARPLR